MVQHEREMRSGGGVIESPPRGPPAGSVEIGVGIPPAARDCRAARFWALWRSHRPHLFHQSLSMMGGRRADAEDALSATTIKASQAFENTNIDNERAWLRQILRNVCMDLYRERQRRARWDGHAGNVDHVADRAPSPEETTFKRELLALVRTHILKLPPNLREPLLLRCLEGLAYNDIARRLAISSAAARKRVQLARAELRSRVGGPDGRP